MAVILKALFLLAVIILHYPANGHASEVDSRTFANQLYEECDKVKDLPFNLQKTTLCAKFIGSIEYSFEKGFITALSSIQSELERNQALDNRQNTIETGIGCAIEKGFYVSTSTGGSEAIKVMDRVKTFLKWMEMDLAQRLQIEPVHAIILSVVLPQTNCEIDRLLSERKADDD